MQRAFRYPVIFVGLLTLTGTAAGATTPDTKLKVSLRVDCTSNLQDTSNSIQACLTLSGLRLTLQHQENEEFYSFLQLDPFGTPVASLRNTPHFSIAKVPFNRDVNASRSLIDDFGVYWQFRQNLRLGLEEISGTTLLPNSSGLAFGSRLQDIGWDQLALTALYNLPALAGIEVLLAIGNGEGESYQNLDPQQFGGLQIKAHVAEGFYIQGGLSFDGNNAGSDALTATYGAVSEGRLFSTERQAFIVGLDGTRPGLRGLVASIGWQRNQISDLDKDNLVLPSDAVFNEQDSWDANNLLVESDEKAIQIRRTTVNLSLSYKILDTYFIGADFENRMIDTDEVQGFTSCRVIDSSGCIDPVGQNKLEQAAFTVGLGMSMGEKAKLVVEYHESRYDKLYQYFNHAGPNDQKAKSTELANVRITYQW